MFVTPTPSEPGREWLDSKERFDATLITLKSKRLKLVLLLELQKLRCQTLLTMLLATWSVTWVLVFSRFMTYLTLNHTAPSKSISPVYCSF